MDDMILALSNLDPTTVATTGGIAASVAGMTEWITDEIVSLGLKDKLYRFYPLIPFICAFIVGYMTDQNFMDAIKDCFMYGSGAIALHNAHETVIKGQ
jgi:hypothetical protein